MATVTRSRGPVAVRMGVRPAVAVTFAAFLGVVAFCWPFLVAPGQSRRHLRSTADLRPAPALVLAVVLAELADGGIDAKALAMLGVLSAIGAALRPLGAGTAGHRDRVLRPRAGRPGVRARLRIRARLHDAVRVGDHHRWGRPWLPYQMFGCAFVGLFAGLLPFARGRTGDLRCSPATGRCPVTRSGCW